MAAVEQRNCVHIQHRIMLNIYLHEKTTKFAAKTLFITLRETQV